MVDTGDPRRTQLLRGVLDTCLLALIAERPRYGYELIEALTDRGLALVSEGSIYPLLARLERSGLVTAYRAPSASGPPRKYYRLTDQGVAELAAGRRSWDEFAAAVSRVFTGALERVGEDHDANRQDAHHVQGVLGGDRRRAG
jgi:PadR family transcriptional regulator PadR